MESKIPKKLIKHKPELAGFRGLAGKKKERKNRQKKKQLKVFVDIGEYSAEQTLYRYLMQHVLLAGPFSAQERPITF